MFHFKHLSLKLISSVILISTVTYITCESNEHFTLIIAEQNPDNLEYLTLGALVHSREPEPATFYGDLGCPVICVS